MIKKFTSGNPIDTQAVVWKILTLCLFAEFPLGGKLENGKFVFEFWYGRQRHRLRDSAKLREESTSVVGCITAFAVMTRSTQKLSHPFMPLTISLCSAVQKTFGIFIDFPSKIRWDIGYTTTNKTVITIDGTDFDIYHIDGTKPLEIVKEFRKSIGTSYVPPFWAFGYQQSRWSYYDAEAVDAVVRRLQQGRDSAWLRISRHRLYGALQGLYCWWWNQTINFYNVKWRNVYCRPSRIWLCQSI